MSVKHSFINHTEGNYFKWNLRRCIFLAFQVCEKKKINSSIENEDKNDLKSMYSTRNVKNKQEPCQSVNEVVGGKKYQ